tara:strand:+ start:10726 stop:11169 length:444 start_codon:yes stop_codon:yes gene_type:complete
VSKFNDILRQHGIITEQPEATDVPAGTPGAPESTAVDQSAISATPEEPTLDNQKIPDSEVKKLSPSSFVWLVTVLKNAFLAHPELEDQKTVSELKGPDGEAIEEINPENAQQVLDAMWPVISKYMPGELKTSEQVDKGVTKLLQKVS